MLSLAFNCRPSHNLLLFLWSAATFLSKPILHVFGLALYCGQKVVITKNADFKCIFSSSVLVVHSTVSTFSLKRQVLHHLDKKSFFYQIIHFKTFDFVRYFSKYFKVLEPAFILIFFFPYEMSYFFYFADFSQKWTMVYWHNVCLVIYSIHRGRLQWDNGLCFPKNLQCTDVPTRKYKYVIRLLSRVNLIHHFDQSRYKKCDTFEIH